MKKILDIIQCINQFNPEPISNVTIKALLASYNILNITIDSLNKNDLYEISYNCIKKSCAVRLEKAKTFGEDENIQHLYEKIKEVNLESNPNQDLVEIVDKIVYFKQSLTFIENEFIRQLYNCIVRSNLTSDLLLAIPEKIFKNIVFIALQVFASATVKHQEIFNTTIITSIEDLSKELNRIRSQISDSSIADDVNKLKYYNQSVLDLISTRLEQNETRIELERLNIIKDIEKAIETNNFIGITGEPGVGKSALLKKIALKKGKFIAISDKKLFEQAQGWSSFFQTNLEELLLYLNQEGFEYIFIDGIDKITHPDHQTVIQELMNVLQRIKQNTDWKIIFTTRSYDDDSINSSIVNWLDLNDTFYIPVNEIGDEEFIKLIQKFPKLSSIFYQKELSKITRNLFLLKILLSTDFYESLKDNEKISEIDISRLWWQESIGNGLLGKHRQHLLKIIANNSIDGLTFIPDENTNIYALDSLLKDKILIERAGNEYTFREDIFEDWVIYQVLYNKRQDIKSILESSKQFGLYRPFQLLSNYLLETKENAEIWNDILEQLETIRINKYIQAFISAPLISMKIVDCINKLENILINKDNNYKYLNIVLNKLKSEGTYPDLSIIYPVLYMLKNEEIEDFSNELFSINNLLEYRLPKELAWYAVIAILIRNIDELKINFSINILIELFDFYQRKAKYNYFSKQLGDISYSWYLENKFYWHSKKGEYEEKLLSTFLYSAGENQESVKKFIYSIARSIDAREEKEQLLKINNAQILIDKIPRDYGNCLIGILLKKLKEEGRDPQEMGFSPDDFTETLGIETYRYSVFEYPLTIGQGPLLCFLNHNKDEALRVIKAITKWAMNVYFKNKQLTPTPFSLQVGGNQYKFYGDEFIYLWFRNFPQTPAPIASALMDLERWCINQSLNRPLNEIINDVLANTNCIVFIGIAISLIMYSLKENKEEALKELFKIVTSPQILRLEDFRFKQDLATSLGSPNMHRLLGIPQDKVKEKIMKSLNDVEHRKYRLLNDVIMAYYIYGQLEEKNINELIDNLKTNTIFLFEEEKRRDKIQQELNDKLRFYLSFLDKNNWKAYKYADGQTYVQYEDKSIEAQEAIEMFLEK